MRPGDGTRSPDEIQAEIERTRREMDGTLSALEHRLTPGQLVDQCLQYLRRSGGQEFVSNLGQQVKENPLPVALVGLGVAWLMASGREDSSGASGPGVGERVAEVRERASQLSESARQQIDSARSRMDEVLREQPLALGAVGLAVGALAAALAPRPREEAAAEGDVGRQAPTVARDFPVETLETEAAARRETPPRP